MDPFATLRPDAVLDSVAQGVYVTDTSRKIIYWNAMAERITGWPSSEIVGKRCFDNILCHVDKDGHRLCGEEHCPLHRSIMTGQTCAVPGAVFAQHKQGGRIPMQITVAPVRGDDGQIIGGVETFRDLSDEISDIRRARTIQSLSQQQDLPEDPRLLVAAQYSPHDMIGGDFHAMARLDADRYGILIADVAGHGVAAALYTMHLSSLWENNHELLVEPGEFMRFMNEQLCRLIREAGPFAACVCGVLDLRGGTLRQVTAGNPGPLLVGADGRWQDLTGEGFPLGIIPDAEFDECTVRVEGGDCVLFYTDGALEITNKDGTLLGQDGLETALSDLGYPDTNPDLAAIEEALLVRSNCIRFDDDFTLLELRLR